MTLDLKEFENKIINADCLELMKEIPDKCIDAIICDLPYGTTACSWDVVIPFDKLWEQYKRIIKDRGAIVLFGKEPFSSMLRLSNLKEFKYDWIWEKDTKSNFPQASYQPLNNIELISVFSNGHARYGNKKMPYYPQMTKGRHYNIPKESKTTSIFAENHKNGTYKHKERDTSLRYPYNKLKFNTEKGLHPTQKPVALLEYLIKTYSNEGDLILDNCSGSGTTAVACHNLKRRFICIEKDYDYWKASVERLKNAQAQLKLAI